MMPTALKTILNKPVSLLLGGRGYFWLKNSQKGSFSQKSEAMAMTVNGASMLRTKPLEKAVINVSDPQ